MAMDPLKAAPEKSLVEVEAEAYNELKRRVLEAESNMVLAAEAGQDLLQRLQAVQAERDDGEQERHQLKLLLEHKSAMEVSLMEELDMIKQDNKLKHAEHVRMQAEWEQREKVWRSKEMTLENTVEQLKSDLARMSAEAEPLAVARRLEAVRSPPAGSPIVSHEESISLLYDEMEKMKTQNQQLHGHNLEMQLQLAELRMQLEASKISNSQIKELLEEKELELSSYQASMGQARSQIQELQSSNDSMLDADLTSKKGNSLFSEVEDRRMLVEDKLKHYKLQLDQARILYESLQRQLAKTKAHNATLLNMMSGEGHSSKHIKRLEDLLHLERNKSLALLKQLQQLAGDSKPQSSGATRSEEGCRCGLAEQFKVQIRLLMESDDKLQDMSKKLAIQEKELIRAKSDNYMLNMKLSKLRLQQESATAPAQITKAKDENEKIFEPITFEKEQDEENGEVLCSENPAQVMKDAAVEHPAESNTKRKTVRIAVEEKEPQADEEQTPEDKENRLPDRSQGSKKKGPVKLKTKLINAEEESNKMNEQCAQQ